MFEGRGPADHRPRGSREPGGSDGIERRANPNEGVWKTRGSLLFWNLTRLGFGLCCNCLVSLTQAMEETSIGRRPPSDWHVVKCMGIFLTNNWCAGSLVLGCLRKPTEWAWEAGQEAAHHGLSSCLQVSTLFLSWLSRMMEHNKSLLEVCVYSNRSLIKTNPI